MTALPSDLRGLLEKAVVAGRAAAESAAKAAVTSLAVDQSAAYPSLTEEQRSLRNLLRARARQLGEGRLDQGIAPLTEEVAYVQWHRMLFARFLAENGLLMHPSDTPVTIGECAEIAAEEGIPDGWVLAADYASRMLPGIFRSGDPVAAVRFAPEGRAALERLLANLPPSVFRADDALGWTYQFWQTKRKKEVNASGRKIGGEDLAAVTQIFTEDYMVRFLLENSLGAWWAARHPDSPLVKEWSYLRFKDDGTPAAGTFPGWPTVAAEVTVMDPCCGSGHFLVAAFEMLRRMRMEEEGLSAADAVEAILRDNLFGLEIDPRCVQVAAFNLAFTAWKAVGYRRLPIPNVACSGTPVVGQLDEWKKLADGDVNLQFELERLYDLFKKAPEVGSLISPLQATTAAGFFGVSHADVFLRLDQALSRERKDPALAVFGASAEGVARAARMLGRGYALVSTNLPYLTRSKQSDPLIQFCNAAYPNGKADLAAAFLERCRAFAFGGGATAIVTPQNWLSLTTYMAIRKILLAECTWQIVVWLGAGAFESVSGEVVQPTLLIITNTAPPGAHKVAMADASGSLSCSAKQAFLRRDAIVWVDQRSQLSNPDSRVVAAKILKTKLLADYADALQGISTGDYPRFGGWYWEAPLPSSGWAFQQSTVETSTPYGGREHVIRWGGGTGELARSRSARIQGLGAWGKRGVAVSQMGHLPATIYTGDLFDNNTAVILPKCTDHLPAIWAFCKSPEYAAAVRRIDNALKVTNGTLVKVPFDLDYWQRVAEVQGPLPEPYSDDPTQWLFKGTVSDTLAPLQVAVARLLGYRWPDQEPDVVDELVDQDGIACLPAIAGEPSAADRLRQLLATAFGAAWSPALLDQLLAKVEFGGKDLDEWLRDGFFVQHCRLFHNRPFIWHIWDGRKDGFSALVNYHRLDNANLGRLIYTYLGAWINLQKAEAERGISAADGRLVAALKLKEKLELIRAGEPNYDIYVRWKPLSQQPIGWEPDLNDGVRLNVRPFVTAGVLRSKFTINWNKDRGTNPDGSERLNDLHFTNAEKWVARELESAESGQEGIKP